MPKKKVAEQEKLLRITLIRSAIGYSQIHKATVRALGLNRMNQTVIKKDIPAIRGMIAKVNHLVHFEEQVEE
jgi:large subunit ribosomal protein L30